MSIKYLSPQIRRSTGRRTSRSRSFRNDRSNHRRLRLVHQTDGESTGYDLQRETVRTKSLLCLSSGMCSEFTRSEFRPWMCLFRSDQCFVFFVLFFLIIIHFRWTLLEFWTTPRLKNTALDTTTTMLNLPLIYSNERKVGHPLNWHVWVFFFV